MCILPDAIIVQLSLGRIIVVAGRIKAPKLIQAEHLEMKLHWSTGQVISLLFSKKPGFPTSLPDLPSIHGAAQMGETPCLRENMVPDDRLKPILFLMI